MIFTIGATRRMTRYERLPIMWGPGYASGAAAFGTIGQVDLAAEVKKRLHLLASDVLDLDKQGFRDPTYSGHADWRPSPTWRFGLSASVGPYLRPDTGVDSEMGEKPLPVFPKGKGISDYNQTTVVEDITFAWRHWQVWAECFESRFEVPRVGPADTVAYYVEGRYKFTPQLFAALRWNQQLYSEVPIGDGQFDQWGNDVWRIDAALTYRWTERIQTKVQYSFTDQNLPAAHEEHLVAGQLTVKY